LRHSFWCGTIDASANALGVQYKMRMIQKIINPEDLPEIPFDSLHDIPIEFNVECVGTEIDEDKKILVVSYRFLGIAHKEAE